MSEDAKQIVSILASASPEYTLKETTFAALSQRASVVLDDFKKIIAESYFGNSSLDEDDDKDRVINKRVGDEPHSGVTDVPKQKPQSKAARIRAAKAAINRNRREHAIRNPYLGDDVNTYEGEDLQELSKKTLGSYVGKAIDSNNAAKGRSFEHGHMAQKNANKYGKLTSDQKDEKKKTASMVRMHDKESDDQQIKSDKRTRGIKMAARKLAKEEVDFQALEEAVKKAKSPAEKQKAIDAFMKAGKYKERSTLRYAPLKFKKDRAHERMMSQARYNASPESEAYWSS